MQKGRKDIGHIFQIEQQLLNKENKPTKPTTTDTNETIDKEVKTFCKFSKLQIDHVKYRQRTQIKLFKMKTTENEIKNNEMRTTVH